MTTTIDILIKPVKTKYSTSKSSTVGRQILGRDIEEGRRPYSPEEEFVEGIRSTRHKMSSEPLILEDSARKCREDNERIIHIQEQIMNDLKSLKTIQRSTEKNHKRGYVRYRSSSRRPYHSERKKGYVSSSIESSPERYPVRYKKRRFTRDELVGELRRIKPPTFDGEVKQGEDAESWLLGLRNFFQLHQYTPNMEARVDMYHLQGKEYIWWDQLVKLKDIDEEKTSWRKFKKYFKKDTSLSTTMTRIWRNSLSRSYEA